jgi:HD-like signal output (HDOD) protein
MMTECRAGLSVYPPDWMFKGNELMPILLATAMQRIERILERVTELPFSPVARMTLQLARDEQIGAREIARVIAQDQGFTARLLKIANSPYYGQARAVTTVTQAVPVLDIDTISSLATALGALPRAR